MIVLIIITIDSWCLIINHIIVPWAIHWRCTPVCERVHYFQRGRRYYSQYPKQAVSPPWLPITKGGEGVAMGPHLVGGGSPPCEVAPSSQGGERGWLSVPTSRGLAHPPARWLPLATGGRGVAYWSPPRGGWLTHLVTAPAFDKGIPKLIWKTRPGQDRWGVGIASSLHLPSGIRT